MSVFNVFKCVENIFHHVCVWVCVYMFHGIVFTYPFVLAVAVIVTVISIPGINRT